MISLYTTVFNLDKLDVDFDEVFSNWLYYADEIVIATFRWEHEQVRNKIIKSKFFDSKKIGVVSRHLEIEQDVYWEGKLKNAALEACKNEIAIQCDLDERISGSKDRFEICCKVILDHDFPCSIMLPTIDLYEDLDHYINIGHKWYLHTKKGAYRGSVVWARKEDGSLDPEKSDTCELIDADGNLIPCVAKLELDEDNPKIIHLGHLDLEYRNKINQFWGKIWNHRDKGKFDADFQPEKAKAGDPRKEKHNLPQPLWPTIS
jgi:hypothetical protein|tara:strand:- start:8744 stop:9526 length:783 start_codon:yes stop_codon:yes gene_type:complete